jgi:arylsulfatase A-like enzyme
VQADTDVTSDIQPPERSGLARRSVASTLSVALFGLLAACRGQPTDPLTQLRPGSAAGANLLVITLDTTRADHLGCYANATAETPVIDALAARGIRFASTVTPAPVTLPAHTSLFTGLYPPTHGVRNNGEYRLAPDHQTLAEILQANGYETGAFVSAFILDARFGLNQGFDRYDDRVAAATGSAFPAGTQERRAAAVTDAALEWLATRESTRPFFAWVHYFDPHAPYQPPEPFAARFAGRLYDGEIAYMDTQIGGLLRGLQQAARADRTLIVVVGDHGEGLAAR